MLDNAHFTIRVIENKPDHDVIYSLLEAPDGTLYVGLCGETGHDGCYAQILKYNKEEGTFSTLVDTGKIIPHPENDIRPPHSKLHTTFCMDKYGRLLASTHMTAPPLHEDSYHYWHIYNDPDRCYLGSHLLVYDPKTNHAEDLGVVMPKGGARWMTYNPEREEVYMTSFLTCHFHIVSLKTGEIRDIGRIAEHDWLGPCYCPADGRVYTTDSQGNFLRYTPETQTIETLPLYTPRAPWCTGEACGIFNLVPGNDGTKLYGSAWNTMHVFELDPLAGKYGKIRDYGPIGIDEESPIGHPIGKRFPRMLTVGRDNKIYIGGNDYVTRSEAPRLFSIDISSGERTDLGIMQAEGFPRFGGACSICASQDGSIYFGGNPTCGLTAMYIYSPDGKNRPLPENYDRFRPPPQNPNEKWVPPTYHLATPDENTVFVARGRFISHDEGRPGHYPVIPRGEGFITALHQDETSRTVFATTRGKKPHFCTYIPSIDLMRSMTQFGQDGDVCNALLQARNGKLYFGTCNPELAGALYCYDVPAVRHAFMEMANCDRGEFMEYCPIPKGKQAEILDCHLGLANFGPKEGVYALAAKDDTLYGITSPGGIFFRYNLETREIRIHHIFRSLIQESANLSKCLFVYENGLFFSGHHGYLIRYDIPSDSFTETGLKIPCARGREYLNTLDAVTPAKQPGIFYGGTHADGFLFRLNLADMTLTNLGKPTDESQIRGLTMGKDSMLWGIAGRENDLAHLFSLNTKTGNFCDEGMMRTKIPFTWIIHRASPIITGTDGELYIGEQDDIAHLFSYYPPIQD